MALLPLDEALPQILDGIPRLGTEDKGILDAVGQVLAENVRSDVAIPPFANSAMDGFAVRTADLPGQLEVIADQPAGYVTSERVGPGTAIRIMTGAAIPDGADAVVPVEDTEASGPRRIRVSKGVPVGEFIRPAGEDIAAGEVVLPAGSLLKSAAIGVLASIGRPRVKVYRRPVVAFMSSGDELVAVDEPLGPGKIRNANSYTLKCQIDAAGGIPLDLGVARDNLDDIREHIEYGLEADLFLTSAGVSVGDFDYVRQVLEERGTLTLWRVAIRPGRPIAFGIFDGKPVISLPGNPVSSMVCFELFVRPAIAKMMGRTDLEPATIQACTLDELDNRGGRRTFFRAIVEAARDGYEARLTGPQGSNLLTSMARANALLDVAAEVEIVPAGDTVRAILLDSH